MPTIVSVQGGADAASGATTTPTTSPQSAKIAQPNKRNRRKSMHHPLCVSPEIEFETIALEDDDEENASTKEKTKIHTNTEVVQQQNKSPKSHKTASNNLNSQVNPPASSNEKEFRDACSELLKSEKL
ncbi:unnamed protein product [Ceratitis capitata]|uniref:(Mediterranean fruit fly) hypothetical protein n=1 Tax=Ceratitis capitata TaxID=7213 RepID=A0A811UEA7_CERCA|nr:unnamed protein product [Ceratitis capitata]